MKSHWRELARLIGMPIPAWQQPIFDYLEQRGLMFCVHFGRDNAWRLAHDLYWRDKPEEERVM